MLRWGVASEQVGGQYVCAHWRTGDWDVPMSASILLSSVAKVLASERREAGGADGAADGADGAGEGGASSRDSRESRVPRDSRGGGSRTVAVYLASDASDAQRALVARNLTLLPPISCKPPATGPWCQREGDWEEWEYDAVEDAILEQLVCAHAWVFIGTRGSTFSEAIVEERARRGFALASNYLVP
ncbi:hypothetical protein T484DRAFT_2084054 [Baffinella frigidus]|nr:hypothetical protein T484DRAFT_2084054 [Cryptophyta sp. CCMP2293]